MTVRLSCKNYGFDCDFEAEAEDITKVVEIFENHTLLKHGMKYSLNSLTQFILNPKIFCPYCNSKFEAKEDLSEHIDRIHSSSGLLDGDVRNF